jgi:hypothetical protein
MKPLLLTLTLLTISTPAQAITWKEFWEPFGRDEHHHHHYREYSPMCHERIVREEYVPGGRWRSGYVRRWVEWVYIPCYDRRYYPQ